MSPELKKSVYNCEGDLIRERVEEELEKYETLLKKVRIVYQYITDGTLTDPFTETEKILSYFEKECSESYNKGFDVGYEEGAHTLL